LPKIVPVPWRDFERVIIKAGCRFVRQEGDHRVYKKQGLKRPIVLPTDDNVPVFVIKNNLRTLNLSREGYFKLLAQI
jgi:predicted RNA binding protein YcfA (HicA-like mRNA interferase family)